jgi:hypothetical protein
MARKKYLVEMDEEDMQALAFLLKRASNFSVKEVEVEAEVWGENLWPLLEPIFLQNRGVNFGDPLLVKTLLDNGYSKASRSMLLGDLVRVGKIVKTGRGKYALAH